MKKLNWFDRIRGYFLWRFGKFQYRAMMVADNPTPEAVHDNIVYVVGGEGYVKWAYLKCPDGCGETIMLSLSQNRHPSWEVKQDKRGRVTLHPSVHKKDGCKSHFWVQGGRLIWV